MKDQVKFPGTEDMDERPSEVLPREFLCCPLCREEFQDPKYLHCLHSFCKACIDSHIKTTKDNKGCYACPVCATEVVISEPNTPTLPDNTFAKRLSCPITVPEKREKICGQCKPFGTSSEASIHCINCDEFMCETCALNHLEQEETISHKIQKMKDYKEIHNNLALASNPRNLVLPQCCEFYDALDIGSTYCVDCEVSLCAECHTRIHTDHRCAELSAISQNFEIKIKNPLKDLQKDHHILFKALESLENARKYASEKHEEVEKTVKQRTQVLYNLIQEYENMVVMEIEKRHMQNLAMIQEREVLIQRHIGSITAVTDLTEKLLTFGSVEEKVSMRRQIGRRVRELCESELPTKHVNLISSNLSEPAITVETICEMFGVLQKNSVKKSSYKKCVDHSQNIDEGVMNKSATELSVSSNEELTDLEEDEGMDMLSASNTSDKLRSASSMLSETGAVLNDSKLEYTDMSPRQELGDPNNDSFQSSFAQEDVPCLNLEVAKREMCFPEVVARDCIKGVGVNSHGDIIVGTVSPHEGSKVFILEKHGIVRGQIQVVKNWLIHSIAADGKVSLVMPRSENRYKVKVMSGENNIDILVDVQIESFGLNSVTATKFGILLVTANRYATTTPVLGRSAKHGGNITMYDKEGTVLRIITNETFAQIHNYLFDRPHIIATDHQGNFFVGDPGRHSVTGFKSDGELMFEYGNTDAEEELYQGPDAICADRKGNVIVFDKKDGRIDILCYEGHLRRCYFPCEHIRFVCSTPDNTLMLVNSAGEMKFYDYILPP